MRFTRGVLGLIMSPFILGWTLKLHLETKNLEQIFLKTLIELIQDSLYANDIVIQGKTVE